MRDKIDQFILTCDPCASLVLWEKVADSAVRQAAKRETLIIDSVVITKPEMAVIEAIHGKQAKRLALTILCLSKYWNLRRKDNDNWVTNKQADIMAMANIKASARRQGALLRQLEDDGLLHFPTRVDSISMQVLFNQDGEPEMEIRNFNNIGYQYLKYKGEPFFECSECGLVTKIKSPGVGRPPKYCPNCAAKIRIQQNVNAVMRARTV